MIRRFSSKGIVYSAALLALFGVSACVERAVTAPLGQPSADPDARSGNTVAVLDCAARVASSTVECTSPRAAAVPGASPVLIGGQNSNVKLTSSAVSYDAGTEIFQFDVTVQNLMNEAIGTPNGTVADPEGIQVFFYGGPDVTSGTGLMSVANPDSIATFTGSNQPFFAYHEILAKDQVSAPKTWQLNMPATVNSFGFLLYIETDVQPLLVINEVLSNPGGTISDANGEWFEIYNSGTRPVNLQNFVIADSAASGRRPYHLIASSLVVAPGTYATLGNTTNTTNNGGVPIDYAYGAALALQNSFGDAIKISRVYGTDTLTIDRAAYELGGAITYNNGVSRELLNPALDNSQIGNGNWADPLVSAVYGPGGRGTPKAQNSTFTP